MKFLYLWPLVFLIVVPVIIIMYMLKQRAKDQPFSSIFLWHELYANHEADTPWEKLKKNILLFLQLLALLLLILALCSPYLLSGGKQAENVICNEFPRCEEGNSRRIKIQTARADPPGRIADGNPDRLLGIGLP